MSCQEEYNLVFNRYFQIFVTLCVLSAFSSYFVLIILLKNVFKVYWHWNMKILFYTNMFVSFSLATTVNINFIGLWYRMYNYENSCDVAIKLEYCEWLRRIFLGSFCLIGLNHWAMFLERLYATLRMSKYEKSLPFLGIILVVLIIVIAYFVVKVIMIPEDPLEYVPSCLSISATKIGNGLYWLFTIQSGMEILLAFFQLLLLRFNRKRCEKVKHLDDNLSEKYQMNENLAVSEQMSPLVITCSMVIGFYQIIAIVLRRFRLDMTKNNYTILAFAIFIIPHLPLILNLMSVYTLHKQLKARDEMAKKAVKIDIERNANFSNDFYNWDEGFNFKYAQKPVKTSRNYFALPKFFHNKVRTVQ
ncbi:unnamed protein product [Caenorhabditis brenneri]